MQTGQSLLGLGANTKIYSYSDLRLFLINVTLLAQAMDQAKREYARMLVSKAIIGPCALIAVVLRFNVRLRIKKQRLGWDDTFCVLALIVMVAEYVCSMLSKYTHCNQVLDPFLRMLLLSQFFFLACTNKVSGNDVKLTNIPPAQQPIAVVRRMRIVSVEF